MSSLFRLPQTATAPFCPSEVRGSVAISAESPLLKRMLRMAGPGLLVSVGYMDPGKLLVASQVALSLQLPFAIWPLIRLTSDPWVMGRHTNGWLTRAVSWLLFAMITVANLWLIGRLLF